MLLSGFLDEHILLSPQSPSMCSKSHLKRKKTRTELDAANVLLCDLDYALDMLPPFMTLWSSSPLTLLCCSHSFNSILFRLYASLSELIFTSPIVQLCTTTTDGFSLFWSSRIYPLASSTICYICILSFIPISILGRSNVQGVFRTNRILHDLDDNIIQYLYIYCGNGRFYLPPHLFNTMRSCLL